MTFTATYSPEDNKLRLYASARLDADLYARVKAAGFSWAPRQELFVAPAWSPQREDLLLELAGEIGDEDSSLVDRAEDRAERFSDYSDSRAQDAENARKGVAAIADNIPFGQPILVGHHSEKHARKDAEKIENGMRRAVKMWETSEYWKDRAAGAIRHAKYKERPDVRARRIKTIEADIRSYRSKYTPQDNPPHVILQHRWNAGADDPKVPHVWCGAGRGGQWVPVESLPGIEKVYSRWIKHCELRLEYERAMLAEGGGLPADSFDLQPGGRVKVRGEWATIIRVTRKDGKVLSVTTNARYVPVRSVEEIREYTPPSAEEAQAVKAATKLAPLCNYPSEDCHQITKAEWDDMYTDYKGSTTLQANEKHGAHRVRSTYRGGKRRPVFLTDSKRVDPPAPLLVPAAPVPEIAPAFSEPYTLHTQTTDNGPAGLFDAMRETLKAGVQVVSAPQLFPTPEALAARMVELAEIEPTHRVLEPSAGTGAILKAIGNGPDKVAVEINPNLVAHLARCGVSGLRIHEADFLGCNGDLGKFDRVLMNPPFQNADDIKHIQHAISFLNPGGVLVAICANGPRQQEKLKPLAESWEVLPAGTFAGTGVNAALLVIRKDEAQ